MGESENRHIPLESICDCIVPVHNHHGTYEYGGAFLFGGLQYRGNYCLHRNIGYSAIRFSRLEEKVALIGEII